MEDIKKCFKKYLKDNRANRQFEINLNSSTLEQVYGYDTDTFLKNCPDPKCFFDGFQWYLTTEGFSFWSRLQKNWVQLLKQNS